MINQYILDEAMKLPILNESNNIGLIDTLNLINKYAKVSLKLNDKYEPIYEVNVDEILKSEMEMEDAVKIRYGGFEYSDDKKLLIKKI